MLCWWFTSMMVELPTGLCASDFAQQMHLIRHALEDTQYPAVALYEMVGVILQALLARKVLYQQGSFAKVVSWNARKQLRMGPMSVRTRRDSCVAHMMRYLHMKPAVNPFNPLRASHVHRRSKLSRWEALVQAEILGRLSKVRQRDLPNRRQCTLGCTCSVGAHLDM